MTRTTSPQVNTAAVADANKEGMRVMDHRLRPLNASVKPSAPGLGLPARLIEERGLKLTADVKDLYVNALRQKLRKPSHDYFLDRLLSAAVIEARGAERFEMIGNALEDAKLASFYQTLARSESQHHQLFLDLALTYFDPSEVDPRLEFWLTEEAAVLAALPVRPRLH